MPPLIIEPEKVVSVLFEPTVIHRLVVLPLATVPLPVRPPKKVSSCPALILAPAATLRLPSTTLWTAAPLPLFAGAIVRIPDPATDRPVPEPTTDLIGPMVSVPALSVTVRWPAAPPRVTVPVPRFRLLVPVNVRSALTFEALLLARVIGAPEVLSMVLFPLTVIAPVPTAVERLMLSVVPAAKDTPPANVLFPESVNVPEPAVTTLPGPVRVPPKERFPPPAVIVSVAVVLIVMLSLKFSRFVLLFVMPPAPKVKPRVPAVALIV